MLQEVTEMLRKSALVIIISSQKFYEYSVNVCYHQKPPFY
jgi:hypothetical protein